MAGTWVDTFCRGARKLQRTVGQPMVAVAVGEHHSGIAAPTLSGNFPAGTSRIRANAFW